MGTLVRAVSARSADVRHALLPADTNEVSPRVFAVVAGSLIDELARPPRLPVSEPLPETPTIEPSSEETPTPEEPETTAALPATPPPEDEEPELIHAPVAVDLTPYIGSSLAYRGRELRRFSLNIVGGYGGALEGLEIGSAFNVLVHHGRGLQIAGAFNMVGAEAIGLQISGAFNLVRGEVVGLQIGGAFNIAGADLTGLQIGGAFNTTRGDVRGLQVGGAFNLALGRTVGAQISGAFNLVRDAVTGLQLTGALNYAESVRGSQVGLINIARGEVAGAQVGLVNYARSSSVSLGLVNIIPGGRTQLELTGADTGFVHLALKHGSRYLHNIYSLGIRVQDASWSFGLGLGGRIPIGTTMFVDIDLVSHFLNAELFVGRQSMIHQIKVVYGIHVLRWLALTVGISYSFMVTEIDDGSQYPLFGDSILHEGDVMVRSWPGFQIGIQFL